MTSTGNHEIIFTLPVTDVATNNGMVFTVVRKPSSAEGATSTHPYAVWVAKNINELNDPSKRRSPSSSVEKLGDAIRMFFAGRASYTLGSGLSFTLDELTRCKDDDAILELIKGKS